MGNKYKSVLKRTADNVTSEGPDDGDLGPWGSGSVSLRSSAGREASEREREERLALIRARRSRRLGPRRGVALGGLLALLGVVGWVALRGAGGGSESPTLGVAGETRPTVTRRSAQGTSAHRTIKRHREHSRRRAKRRQERSRTAERRQAKDRKEAPPGVAHPEPTPIPASVESAPAPPQAATTEPTEPVASVPPPREPEAASQEFGFER